MNLNLPAQPVYDKLAQIFVGATDQQDAKFDCGLETRPEFKDHIKGGIFADFRVAKSIGKTLSDIRVWNNYSLNSLRHQLISKLNLNYVKNLNHSIVYKYSERSDKTNYSVLDTKITYKKGLYLSVNNILDEAYSETNLVPMPGRNFLVGISVGID